MAASSQEDTTPESPASDLFGHLNKGDLRKTALVSIVFYLILVVAVAVTTWGTSAERVITIEHVLIAVVPFVMLLAFSGKLAEIQGPGNIGLILRHEANREVAAEASSELPQAAAALDELEQQVDPDSQTTFTKGGMSFDLGGRIKEAQPSTLLFTIGKRYNSGAIKEYVRLHTKYSPRFKYILFNGENGQFEGLMHYDDFLHQLDLKPGQVRYLEDGMEAPIREGEPDRDPDDPGYTTGLIGAIESGSILTHAGVVTNSIAATESRNAVLREMERTNSFMLAVTDEAGRYAGVVTQDGVVRELLTDVLRISSS